MPSFSSGLSALRASQYALEIASNNISNANTPGYHRQRTHFSSQVPDYYGNFQIGNGVNISHIERIRTSVTESSLTSSISDVSKTDQLLSIENQIEGLFQNGDGSLSQRLDSFFGEITKLTSTPDSPTQKGAVLNQAEQLATIFQQMSTQLSDLKLAVRAQADEEVEIVNKKMEELADLTVQINSLSVRTEPHQELDQRDSLVNQIAEVVGVTRQESRGQFNLSFGGTSIQQGHIPIKFDTLRQTDGTLGITFEGNNKDLKLDGGRLPALLEAYNEVIPKFEAKLSDLAEGLIKNVDQLHATGVGSAGPFERLEGVRSVQNTEVPLSIANPSFPIEEGELFFSVTGPDGNRTTQSISIDPETQSLEDVATAISGLDNLRASVSPQTNLLQISADPGFRFDFTGTSQTTPDLSAFSGTTIPELTGKYGGDVNQTLSYNVSGTGDVGISENLFVDVFDESGTLVTQLNIGNGYEAGTPLDVVEGVQIAFPPGNIVDGETFSSQLVSQPDETGILSALGLNSLFVGDNALNIEVASRFKENRDLLATGHSGDAADTSNLFALIGLQDERVMANGSLSLAGFVGETTTEIGADVQSRRQLSTNLNSLKVRYEQERDSISGVDLNEELIYLQQYQKSYQAAVRVIQTTDEMLDEIFNILR